MKALDQKPTVTNVDPIKLKEDSFFIVTATNSLNIRGLCNFLLDHNNTQRLLLRDYLLMKYQFSVSDKFQYLETESCDLYYLINFLMLNPYEHLAYHLRQAIIGIGTNTKVINEILCSNKTNEELKQVKKAYESKYGARLERDIYEETAGTYRDFLLELLNGNRSTEVASRNRTAKIVKLLNLYKSSGNEELLSTINTVFATESYDQLREAFAEFILNKSESIQELFETLSDDHKNAFEVFFETIYDEHKFYARRLYEAIDGIGTDDMTLMRIVVGRAEIDLGCISEVYNVMYDESLASAIMGDTSGVYQKSLLTLLGV